MSLNQQEALIQKLQSIIDVLSGDKSPEGMGIAIQVLDGELEITPILKGDVNRIKAHYRNKEKQLQDAQELLSAQQRDVNNLMSSIEFASQVESINSQKGCK